MLNKKLLGHSLERTVLGFGLAVVIIVSTPPSFLLNNGSDMPNPLVLQAYAADGSTEGTDITDTTDTSYTTIVSEIDATISSDIALNNANEEKANTTVEIEEAYEPVTTELALTIVEVEEAYVEPEPEPEVQVISNNDIGEGYYTNINGRDIYVNPTLNPGWDSSRHITASGGVYQGPSGKETYYNLPMGGVVQIMRDLGFDEENWPYWVRDDGCKMLGDYIMVAADHSIRPRGSLVETSMGMGIVCDTGSFIETNPYQLDIAVAW